jgi:hypothetical protein
MRKTLLPLAAAAVVSAAALLPTQASAMTIGTASGIAAAIESSSLMENARYVCTHRWRSSRRHCYWRPSTVCRHSWRTSRRYCYRR